MYSMAIDCLVIKRDVVICFKLIKTFALAIDSKQPDTVTYDAKSQ